MATAGHARGWLRIGIVKSGKLVADRVFPLDQPITVGPEPDDTLVFTELSRSTAVFDPEDRSVEPGDRGKIRLDGLSVLYQIVQAPPVVTSKPVDRSAFRARLLEPDDLPLIQSLASWTVLGLLLAIHVNIAPSSQNLGAQALGTRLVSLPRPTLIIEVEPEPVPVEALHLAPIVSRRVEDRAPEAPEPEPTKKLRTPAQRAANIARSRARIEQRMQKSGLLGSRGESSWSVDPSDAVALDSLDAAPRWSGTEGGTRRQSGGEGEAATIELDTDLDFGGSAEIGGGPEVFTEGAATLSEDFVAPQEFGAIKRTLRRYNGQIRYCYEHRIKIDSSLSGRIEIGALVEAGEIVDLWTNSNTTHDSELERCILKRVRRWHFPTEASGELSWPYVFVQEE